MLLPSWYGGDHHGYDFLIGPSKALDPSRYFIIATDQFSNGVSSSPSNTAPPFAGPDFPQTAIRDNVAATHQLVTELFEIERLVAVVGFSMGAQQALTRRWAAWGSSQEWWRRELFRRSGAESIEEWIENSEQNWLSGDANDLLAQATTWQTHNVGDTGQFSGDLEAAYGR